MTSFEAEPLPPRSELIPRVAFYPYALSAYDACVEFEKSALAQQDSRRFISTRVLGYLLVHAPSHQAFAETVSTIHSCSQAEDTLHVSGQAFLKLFIRAFRKNKGRTPSSSNHHPLITIDSCS